MNRQSMSVGALFLRLPAKPDHAAIATLVKTASLCLWHKMCGRKTLQLRHAGQFMLGVRLGKCYCRGPLCLRGS